MTYEFERVVPVNDLSTTDFDPLVLQKLKCYVYALRSSRTNKVFYIGKGGGAGAGNSRAIDHFKEAERCIAIRAQPTEKIREIIESWRDGESVDCIILRHGLDEPTALHVEAALIDALSLSPLTDTTNLVVGQHAQDHGMLRSDDIRAIKAEPVSPKAPLPNVFVFQIQNALTDKGSVYEATRRTWRVGSTARASEGSALAVGVKNGIAQGVFTIDRWIADSSIANGYEFEGRPVVDSELLNKSFLNVLSPARGFLQFGGGYVIASFDGAGRFELLRGSANREVKYDCL